MLRKNRLFTPGPTPILPAAQIAMAAAAMHHRTADFRALYQGVLSSLRQFVGTNNDVILFASSGTGAMEASVANLTAPGDKVLVITAGKFGERWRDLTKTYGCTVEIAAAPYGQAVDIAHVREKLGAKGHGVRCVYMQATESSTGVRHDVEGVARAVRSVNEKGGDVLFIVDAITGLGTTTFDMDGWGIDVIIGGSQKALMIPPGLSYLAVSERAWKRMEEPHSPAYYFDLRKERKAGAKGESAYTPATSLVAALAAALSYVAQMGSGNVSRGRELLVANAELAAEMTRAAAHALGLKLFASSPCSALTAIVPPGEADSGAIVKEYREKFGAVVANGQGEMKGKLFRIAHLGYYDYMDTIGVIGGLEQIVSHLVPDKREVLGVGVRAAQQVYARATAEVRQEQAAKS